LTDIHCESILTHVPKPRRQQVSPEATAYYHCISRCVRRAFLCGQDRASGKNFDHRKLWLIERMKELAAIFAVDICSYGALSNHVHVILHIDPERVHSWTDEQVAARYEKLFRHTVRQWRKLPEREQARKLLQWRRRLWDLSWFMRCLNESIARRANREDHCTGRFWEGRFRSQALLDEGALLTCMSYVELNPIRAGLATTLEASEFTSIRERLLAVARGQTGEESSLVPFADQVVEGTKRLPVRFVDYVELLRWTAASITGVRESEDVPGGIGTLLERSGLESRSFVASVQSYACNFFTMVGHVHRIEVESRRRGYRRRLGLPAAKRMYRRAAA
jgi:REP element-mobilizing transposase RayT